ncbi:MAG TPA: HAD-IA family hydrolase, partial [Prolixibacteraceae bacterium]|nr:HAD-IA family hydrolase [Prolixibacteraceae bacterium]
TSEAAIRFFAEKGTSVKHEDFFPFYGTGEQGYFGGVADLYGIQFELETDKYKIYDIFAKIAKGKINPMPGAVEFIETVKNKNLKTALGTSAGRYKMRINLNLIGLNENTFDSVVTGEDISNNKPNPEIFEQAAQNIGLKPEECLVIEDAPSGVEAAKNAGCKCLAVQTTFSKAELHKADWICENLTIYPIDVLTW